MGQIKATSPEDNELSFVTRWKLIYSYFHQLKLSTELFILYLCDLESHRCTIYLDIYTCYYDMWLIL